MGNQVQAGDICVVIEREVIAAEGLCEDCVAAGLGKRWAMVRRYLVPQGSGLDKLFGVGEGSIAPKGKPDNLSTGAVDWIRSVTRKGVRATDFTAVTQETVGKVVLGVDAYTTDFDSGEDKYWGLDPEWHDPTPPTPYRLVAWRIGRNPPSGGSSVVSSGQ
ncbi:hypothetical protein LCGC14_0962710 [marine sediment metagenome]|uniref:Uncharacterized protein n=1 Tax=marine sediment metagenome TaxID=412755 RepID=A0A0F9RKH1_9ZZZZ